jgi:four helix bundle protein
MRDERGWSWSRGVCVRGFETSLTCRWRWSRGVCVAAQVIGRQLLRSGASVGAHYREAKRARSTAEFVSRIEGGLQEVEETRYWLELLRDAGIVPWNRLAPLDTEANELTAILVTIAKRTKMKDEG